jgi:uncharacterized membrane protein YsdA (DUF1294 family)
LTCGLTTHFDTATGYYELAEHREFFRSRAHLEQSQARQPISEEPSNSPCESATLKLKTNGALRISDSFAAIWFAALNAAAFVAFGFDKWRATRSGARVPESFLVLLGALGGWPGGLLGMNVSRHKTAKWGFKFKYATALIPFAVEIWAFLHWR